MRHMRSRKTSTQHAQPHTPESRAVCNGSRWAVPIVLFVSFLVYCPTLWFKFVYDDVKDIVLNQGIKSWDSLPGYFVPESAQLFGPSGWHAARCYRPLLLLWLRLNDALLSLQPGYWHLAAVAAHLLMTLMVYLLVRQLLHDWVPAALTGCTRFSISTWGWHLTTGLSVLVSKSILAFYR